MSLDAVNQRPSDVSLSEIFQASLQLKEGMRDPSRSNNEMYKGNLAYLDQIGKIVDGLVEKENTIPTLK